MYRFTLPTVLLIILRQARCLFFHSIYVSLVIANQKPCWYTNAVNYGKDMMATCLLMTGKLIQSWPHPSLTMGGTETQPQRWACLFGPVLSGGHPWTSSPSVWSTNSSISKIRQQWGHTKVNESEGATTETGSEVWQKVAGGLRHRKAIFQSTSTYYVKSTFYKCFLTIIWVLRLSMNSRNKKWLSCFCPPCRGSNRASVLARN